MTTIDDILDSTQYETDDEALSDPIPANLHPVPNQTISAGKPIKLDINQNVSQSQNLPLCLIFNARSIFNKSENMCELLSEIGPDLSLICETFESERKRLSAVINNSHFKSLSYYRKNRAPGGGCAIIFHETRFQVTELNVNVPDGVESCWALFTPKHKNNMKVPGLSINKKL